MYGEVKDGDEDDEDNDGVEADVDTTLHTDVGQSSNR